ncbi:hypothetical protein AB6905_17890 [Carnobacterium maltaromaticum]|uniref:hypothetical protein n=1 Tax=Carnobacterium maltaromaticum TaxID=2751 RepID=UPI0039BE68EF
MKNAMYMNFLFPIGIVFKNVSQGSIDISKIKFKKSIFTTFVNILFLFVLFAIYRDFNERNEPILLRLYVCVILPILFIYIVNQIKVIVKQRELVFIGIVPMIYIYNKVKKRQRETVEKIIEEWIKEDATEAQNSSFKNLVERETALRKNEDNFNVVPGTSVPFHSVSIEEELMDLHSKRFPNGNREFYLMSVKNLLIVLIQYINYIYDEKRLDLSRETILQELLSIDEFLWKEKLPLKVFLAVIKDIMVFDYKKQDFFNLEVLGDNTAQETSREFSFVLDRIKKRDGFISEITANFMTDEIREVSSKYKIQVAKNRSSL